MLQSSDKHVAKLPRTCHKVPTTWQGSQKVVASMWQPDKVVATLWGPCNFRMGYVLLVDLIVKKELALSGNQA